MAVVVVRVAAELRGRVIIFRLNVNQILANLILYTVAARVHKARWPSESKKPAKRSARKN